MKIYNIEEKLNINPIHMSDLEKVRESKSYIIWMDWLCDVDDFTKYTNTKNDIIHLNDANFGSTDLIMLSCVEFDEYKDMITNKSCDVFVSNLNKEQTKKYIEKLNISVFSKLRKGGTNDYLRYIGFCRDNTNTLSEKLNINPITISDISDLKSDFEQNSYILWFDYRSVLNHVVDKINNKCDIVKIYQLDGQKIARIAKLIILDKQTFHSLKTYINKFSYDLFYCTLSKTDAFIYVQSKDIQFFIDLCDNKNEDEYIKFIEKHCI